MSEVRNPRKALLRDLAYLKVLKAISAKRPADATRIFHEFRFGRHKITETGVFQARKRNAKAKATGFVVVGRSGSDLRIAIAVLKAMARSYSSRWRRRSLWEFYCGELQGD